MAAEILNARVDYAEPFEAVLESAKVFLILPISHGEDRDPTVANLGLAIPAQGTYSVDFEIRQSLGTWEEERQKLQQDRLEFATAAEGARFVSGSDAGIKASFVKRNAKEGGFAIATIDRSGLFILGSTIEIQGRPHFLRFVSESGFNKKGSTDIGQRCFIHDEDSATTLKQSVRYLAVRRRTPL